MLFREHKILKYFRCILLFIIINVIDVFILNYYYHKFNVKGFFIVASFSIIILIINVLQNVLLKETYLIKKNKLVINRRMKLYKESTIYYYDSLQYNFKTHSILSIFNMSILDLRIDNKRLIIPINRDVETPLRNFFIKCYFEK